MGTMRQQIRDLEAEKKRMAAYIAQLETALMRAEKKLEVVGGIAGGAVDKLVEENVEMIQTVRDCFREVDARFECADEEHRKAIANLPTGGARSDLLALLSIGPHFRESRVRAANDYYDKEMVALESPSLHHYLAGIIGLSETVGGLSQSIFAYQELPYLIAQSEVCLAIKNECERKDGPYLETVAALGQRWMNENLGFNTYELCHAALFAAWQKDLPDNEDKTIKEFAIEINVTRRWLKTAISTLAKVYSLGTF